MWWGNSSGSKDAKASSTAEIVSTASATATTGQQHPMTHDTKAGNSEDASSRSSLDIRLSSRRKLPPTLLKIVEKHDRDENFFDELVDGHVPESTESNVRFAAYAARVRTILHSAHRYVAYTSDIGESFRPVAHPYLVRGAYSVSWAYILGDVSYEGYKAYWQNQHALNPSLQLPGRQEIAIEPLQSSPDATGTALAPVKSIPLVEDWRTVMAQRAIFQSVASMGLPAFTIHSVVRYSGRVMKDVKNKTIRIWGPIGLGLAVVPFLPSLFDEPVESATEWVFHKVFKVLGGKEYVGEAPTTGREKTLTKEVEEKEL